MDNNQLFVAASRCKLRIATAKGSLTVEDLWDLSLKALDDIAVKLDAQLAPPARRSFLENPDVKADVKMEQDRLALEIIKVVIETRQAENKATYAARQKADQVQFLKGLLEKRKMAELESLSAEEIEAQLKALR